MYDAAHAHTRGATSDAVLAVQEKTQGLQFYSASHPDELRPLVQSVWEYILPTLAKMFSEAGADPGLWRECLQGLVEATCLTAALGFSFITSAFVRTLANFTSLHEPQSMQIQNAHALRHLLSVPERIGTPHSLHIASSQRPLTVLWHSVT